MNEAECYQWAMQALTPIENHVEQHRWEQAVDKVASAIWAAAREARNEGSTL